MDSLLTRAFVSLTIHGLVSTRDGEPSAIVLQRSPSFPQPFTRGNRPERDKSLPPDDISPAPITGRLNLEVRVKIDGAPSATDSDAHAWALGRGRAGYVVPLEVLRVHATEDVSNPASGNPENVDRLLHDLPPLCIKIANPTYSRSLAREAWFYERFERAGLSGILAPRCFGLFSAPLSPKDSNASPLTVSIPGYDYDREVKKAFGRLDRWSAPLREDVVTRTYDRETLDPLPRPELSIYHLDDPAGSYVNSPWATFRERKDSPILTVLILEQLGERMTEDDYPNYTDDIEALFEHLDDLAIRHGDEKYRNLLRAPSTAQVHCDKHGRKHEWLFVDWEAGESAVRFQYVESFLRRGRFEIQCNEL